MERPLPDTAFFDTVYEPGEVVAVSYTGGIEVSWDSLVTTGAPSKIRLLPEKRSLQADGHDLVYVGIEITDQVGNVVPDAEITLKAEVTGCAVLAGFGSGNPQTEDNYTDGDTVTCRGRAMAILRAGYDAGKSTLTISAEGLGKASETFNL